MLYRWLSGPIILAGVLGAIIKRNWKRHEAEAGQVQKETGVPEQL